MSQGHFENARLLRQPLPTPPSASRNNGLRCIRRTTETSFAYLGVLGAGPEATILAEMWSEVVEPVDLRALGAEPPPAGPIGVRLADLPEAALELELDELPF